MVDVGVADGRVCGGVLVFEGEGYDIHMRPEVDRPFVLEGRPKVEILELGECE